MSQAFSVPTATEPSTPSSPSIPTGPLVSRLIAAAVVIGALIWAYASELAALVKIWSDDPNYSHGFLVPPVVAFMFYWLWPRPSEGDAPLKPALWGWALLVGTLILRGVFLRMGEFWLERSTILPTVAALTLAFGGWPLLKKTWPAIIFLGFMFTVPVAINNKISLPLQRMASVASTQLLKLTGLWVMNEGNVIIVGGEKLEVAAACNGLAMLMSLSATIAATIILVKMPNWHRLILLLSVVPIALLCNVLRIAGTAWCYHLMGAAEGKDFAHDLAGWLMMPTALVLVLLELAWLNWLVQEEEVETYSPAATLITAPPATH